ncbi:MAG: Mu transposase C-terminal domain-containing protein [Methylovirgula sp.]
MSAQIPSPHDVLRVTGKPPIRLRVLWVNSAQDIIVTIDLDDPNAWPRLQRLSETQDDLGQGALLAEPFVEYRDFSLDADLDKKRRARRDRHWKAISEFVENMPACFHKKVRTRFVAEAMKDTGMSRPSVVRMLHDYWRRGMNPNALLPRWDLRGGAGQPRVFTGVKLGRPPLPTPEGIEAPPPGMNVTPDERQFFAIAIDTEYANNRLLSLQAAYDRCIGMYFAERVSDPERPGHSKFVPRAEFAESGWPTFGQFKYWVGRDRDLTAITRRRETPRIWDLKNRGLGGSASAGAWGPASRYEIDATVADVYLRSRLDRNQLIGRPVVYVVIDVFSRLITGVYVGLEGPSWIAAMMALANAVADKRAYCASLGIEIEDGEWPAHHLPSILLGDRGELESIGIAQILKLFHVTCENAAAWRPDWKGIVESRFRILQQAFKPYVPGYVDTDFRARGARDYRGDAVLTIDEFERIIVRLILYFNNHHELKSFDRHRGMVEDRVPSVPIDIWNWGISSVGGLPKSPAAERVRFALMPRDKASVTDRGIFYQGRFYESPLSHRQRWSEKVRTKGQRWKVDIGFDKRDTDRIYLADRAAEFGFDVGLLTTRSREVAGSSGWEAEANARTAQAMSRQREQQEQLHRAQMVADNEAEVEAAAAKAAAAPASGSLASQVRGVRSNRAREKEARRAEEAVEFRPQAAHPEQSAEIYYLKEPPKPAGQAARPSYDSLRQEPDE